MCRVLEKIVKCWVSLVVLFVVCFGMDGVLVEGVLCIGMVVGFFGFVVGIVQESVEGVCMYFDLVNVQGGIKGQNIEFVMQDDKYDNVMVVLVVKLLVSQGVFVLMFSCGIGFIEVMLLVLKENCLLLIVLVIGVSSLYELIQFYVFYLCVSYQCEVECVVRYLVGIGVKCIIIVQVNDFFGNDVGKGVIKGLDEMKLCVLLYLCFDCNWFDLVFIMQVIVKVNIEVVVFIGLAYVVVEGVNVLCVVGLMVYVVILFNNVLVDFVKVLGENVCGVIVIQFLFYECLMVSLLVCEVLGLVKVVGRGELMLVQLEGFVVVKLVVEVLWCVGKDVICEGFFKVLDGVCFDFGGLQVYYSEKDYSGLEFIDVLIIGLDGKFWW